MFLAFQAKNSYHHSYVPDPNFTWGHEGQAVSQSTEG